MQLPNAASLERSGDAAAKVEKALMHVPGVGGVTSVVGVNILNTTQNTYSTVFFITLKDWQERTKPDEQYAAILANLNHTMREVQEGIGFAFPPPSIPGVGTSGGVTMILEDRSGSSDLSFLTQNLNQYMAACKKRPEIAAIVPTYLPDVPQLYVDVDKAKVRQQQVSLSDVYTTMQTFMGGFLVNYFNRFGRQWQTYVEAEGDYRTSINNIGQFYVRSANGGQVPLSAVTTVRRRTGPEFTMRFNEYEGAQLNISGAPGYSSGQVMAALEQVFKETMPPGMGYDYSGMSFQEQKAAQGVSPGVIFGLSLLFVFLILAAQYESWSLPFSVLLSTPVAVMGAYLALNLRGLENDVFAQIGLVMLIGLSAKNAILIVEFARAEYASGKSIYDAALGAARLRFRPIIMTAFAFILGCVPLWVATGAGGVSRQILGTVVIGGMLAATVIAVFLIPVTFSTVEWISHRLSGSGRTTLDSKHAPEPVAVEDQV
jgi:HAE1 family hydrophobic/amphiphilic exporter-1